jgi:hypothetical protein
VEDTRDLAKEGSVRRSAGSPGGAIETRYRAYVRQLNELWEGYEILRAVFPIARPAIKAGASVTFRSIPQPNNSKRLSVNDAMGVISRYETLTAPAQTLVQAISLFEQLLADIALRVWVDYPAEVYRSNLTVSEDRWQANLLQIILESSDREEIMERLARSRIQTIGLGNVVEILTRDALRLRVAAHFETGHDDLVETLKEASARRNLWVHNDGRVDRRYRNAVPASTLRLGARAAVDTDYLLGALAAVRTLGSCVAYMAVTANYHRKPRGRLSSDFVARHR